MHAEPALPAADEDPVGEASKAEASPEGSPEVSAEDIQAFVQRWGLDERSAEALLAAPPPAQAAVLSSFESGQKVHNVNAKMMAFLRQMVRRCKREAGGTSGFIAPAAPGLPEPEGRRALVAAPSEDEVNTFIAKWNLPQEAAMKLGELPADLQIKALADFSPLPPDTAEAKFSGFIRSLGVRKIRAKVRQPLTGPPVGAAPPGCVLSVVPQPRRRGDRSVGSGAVSQPAEVSSAPPGLRPIKANENATESFLEQHDLDVASGVMLRTLPKAVMQVVMTNYSSMTGVRNPNAKFRALVRATLAEQGALGSALGGAQDDISRFVLDWGLSQSAEERLRALPPNKLRQVYEEFWPSTGNFDKRLASFVRSIGSGAPSRQSAESWRATAAEDWSWYAWEEEPERSAPVGSRTAARQDREVDDGWGAPVGSRAAASWQDSSPPAWQPQDSWAEGWVEDDWSAAPVVTGPVGARSSAAAWLNESFEEGWANGWDDDWDYADQEWSTAPIGSGGVSAAGAAQPSMSRRGAAAGASGGAGGKGKGGKGDQEGKGGKESTGGKDSRARAQRPAPAAAGAKGQGRAQYGTAAGPAVGSSLPPPVRSPPPGLARRRRE